MKSVVPNRPGTPPPQKVSLDIAGVPDNVVSAEVLKVMKICVNTLFLRSQRQKERKSIQLTVSE